MKNDEKNKNEKVETIRNPKQKNIHEGHRARLLELVNNVGLGNLSDVQAVEFFLSYIFPRGDTNPLAHRLLQEFDSFTHIVEATCEDLMRVKGINKRSAMMIVAFRELFFYFVDQRSGKKVKLETRQDLLDYVEDQLRFRNVEHMLLVALSPANIILQKRILNTQSSTQVGVSAMEVMRFISNSKATSIVIAHCHPYGNALPSPTDNQSFETVKQICATLGVRFQDCLIVGEDGTFSMCDGTMTRTYHDVEELKDVFKNFIENNKNQA